MITIKINGRIVDFDDVSFKIKNDNPALSENFINDGYSYTLKLPKTSRNRTIIRGSKLKITVSWKGFVFVQGNYVLSDNSGEFVGSIVTHGSVFRQNLEETALSSLPLEVVKICDDLDGPYIKLDKWHAHMLANANEDVNKGTHKFPMIYSYGYWEKNFDVQPDDNIVFKESASRANAFMDGSYVKNTAFTGTEMQWTHTVAPCPKINYLVEEIIKNQGFILGDNFLEGIPEYEQMFCFNNYVLDKVEEVDPGTFLNVHGTEIDLKKHVPDTNCWMVFKMLNEVFGINLVIEDKKIHIRKSIGNLKKQPKNYSKLLNNDSRTTQNDAGVNMRFKYDAEDDAFNMFKDVTVYPNEYYHLGLPRIVSSNNDIKMEDDVLTHMPLTQSAFNSLGVLRDKQEYDDYKNSLFDPYLWLGALETKIEVGSYSKLLSDEYQGNGAEKFDHLKIGCFRGIHNTISVTFPDLIVTFIATIWSYNLNKVLNPLLLSNGINYNFGNSSIYISGPDNAFDIYRLEDLKILQGSQTKEVSYHLPMKTILELQKWKDTKHIIQQKISSFIGILSEIDMSLGVNGFSSDTTIKYLVLNEDKNMNFYQQKSTSKMVEIPLSYGRDVFVIKVNSGADSKFTIPTFGSGYNYSLNVAGVVALNGLTGNYTINFPSANTDYVLEISGLFPQIYVANNAERLKDMDVKQWGDVVWSSFKNAFFGCSNLQVSATDVPDLSNVTNMDAMFYSCSSLATLDVSSWNVGSVTNMANMFRSCSSLATLDVSSWNVGSVTNMDAMFYICSSLATLDVSSWNVGSVTNMANMFTNCSSLTTLDVSNWNVSSVTNMFYMFRSGANIIGIENWDMSSVTNLGFFIWANPRWNLANGNNVVKLNTSPELTNIEGLIGGQGPYTNGITDLEITDCSGVTNAANAFLRADGLERLILTYMPSTFEINRTALTGTEIDNLFTSLGTAYPSATITISTAQNTSGIDTTIATLKGWTIIVI